MAGSPKAYLRKVKARTKALLDEEIANAIKRVTIKDILGWFRKNKYGIELKNCCNFCLNCDYADYTDFC